MDEDPKKIRVAWLSLLAMIVGLSTFIAIQFIDFPLTTMAGVVLPTALTMIGVILFLGGLGTCIYVLTLLHTEQKDK